MKSSAEAEVVGISEYLPYNIQIRNFMEAQGYKIERNTIYQDNTSAIKMETNGKNLCTGNSRHVHIRYFFVKDRQDKGEIKIEYCSTNNMLADYFTKPLQGTLFRKPRAVIMGWEHIDSLSNISTHDSDQERVGIMQTYKSENDVNGQARHICKRST